MYNSCLYTIEGNFICKMHIFEKFQNNLIPKIIYNTYKTRESIFVVSIYKVKNKEMVFP